MRVSTSATVLRLRPLEALWARRSSGNGLRPADMDAHAQKSRAITKLRLQEQTSGTEPIHALPIANSGKLAHKRGTWHPIVNLVRCMHEPQVVLALSGTDFTVLFRSFALSLAPCVYGAGSSRLALKASRFRRPRLESDYGVYP